MATMEDGGTGARRPRGVRFWIALALLVGVVAAAIGVVAVWFVFFSSEAPPAPTLQDALSGLGSPLPGG